MNHQATMIHMNQSQLVSIFQTSSVLQSFVTRAAPKFQTLPRTLTPLLDISGPFALVLHAVHTKPPGSTNVHACIFCFLFFIIFFIFTAQNCHRIHSTPSTGPTCTCLYTCQSHSRMYTLLVNSTNLDWTCMNICCTAIAAHRGDKN
jgi:hypothetical protein